jgi:hypothetical protein
MGFLNAMCYNKGNIGLIITLSVIKGQFYCR